jgi:hypothetical protein
MTTKHATRPHDRRRETILASVFMVALVTILGQATPALASQSKDGPKDRPGSSKDRSAQSCESTKRDPSGTQEGTRSESSGSGHSTVASIGTSDKQDKQDKQGEKDEGNGADATHSDGKKVVKRATEGAVPRKSGGGTGSGTKLEKADEHGESVACAKPPAPAPVPEKPVVKLSEKYDGPCTRHRNCDGLGHDGHQGEGNGHTPKDPPDGGCGSKDTSPTPGGCGPKDDRHGDDRDDDDHHCDESKDTSPTPPGTGSNTTTPTPAGGPVPNAAATVEPFLPFTVTPAVNRSVVRAASSQDDYLPYTGGELAPLLVAAAVLLLAGSAVRLFASRSDGHARLSWLLA